MSRALPPDRWRQISQLCHAALAREGDREAFLEQACAGDEALRREVESLLAQAATAEAFLAEPALALAAHLVSDPGTSMPTGQRIGAYQVQAFLGAGGMGEVYRARDTKLGRDVAIKILPRIFTNDPERLARFEREARMLASLNHPQIGAIYDVEESDGGRALILELVEGPTLAERLAKGPIPLAESLGIARQIADALDAAHERGIVHRDLKPANIKITPNGVVKVLDFGLAKLATSNGTAGDLSQSPTLTVGGTHEGAILGTTAYMSPEQAHGHVVDKRTDIWAFGCVLYEMITGRRAFEGGDVSDTLAAILRSDPDWTALPVDTPTAVHKLLRRCLQKDRGHRLADITDARLEIEDALAGGASAPASAAGVAVLKGRKRLAWTAFLVVAVLTVVALGIPTVRNARETPPLSPPEMRTEVVTPATTDPGSFALSPDGRQLVFVATEKQRSQLWLRPLHQTDAEPLVGTQGASNPFWAPDSRSVGFFADGQLKRLDLGAGRPQVLAEARNPMGGAWNQDGDIIFAPFAASPLLRVAATGGAPTAVTHLATGEKSHRFPAFLPDGRRFLFRVGLSGPEAEGVYLASLDAPDTRRRLLADDSAAAYAAPGYLLIVRQGVLMAFPFDAARGTILGGPTAVAPRVGSNIDGREAFSVSAAGLLAYRTGVVRPSEQLFWIDRDGKVTGTLSAAGRPQLTSDGRHVAVAGLVQGNFDIWLIDTTRGVPRRFTFDPAIEIFPVWSPDGSRLIFSSNRTGTFGLFEKPASLARDEQMLLVSADNQFPVDWSPDGRVLLYVNQDSATGDDLWALPLEGAPTPVRVVQTRFSEDQGQFSPDGRWIAYRSNETGQREILLRPFPGPGSQRQVSTGGGSQPRWRRDGKELFYIAADNRLMAVPIHLPSANGTPDVGAPFPLFATRLATPSNAQLGYTVAPNGRFLMNVTSDESSASPITLVQNWTAGLKK